jgi:peptidoglycan/LPS O-acetylase OafA/YrhL
VRRGTDVIETIEPQKTSESAAKLRPPRTGRGVEYRREVDGLRAIAVVPVLLFHAGFSWVRGGFVGVDVFFVISGYLITSLILAELGVGRFSIVSFYERRARRILPALFLIMLACLIPAWFWMTPQRLENFGQSLVAVSVFGNNILLAATAGYFEPAVDEKPLLHTWSLAVEEQYYVFFPVLLLLCWRLGRRWLIALIGVGALLSLAAAQWGWLHRPESNFYLVQGRAWELLLGVLVAFALEPDRSGARPQPLLANTVSIAGLLLIAYAMLMFDDQTPFPSVYALVPTVGTALILYAGNDRTVVGKLLGLPLFVGIGLISYSLYLWHQPLLAFARILSDTDPPVLVRAALLGLSFVLAWLSWWLVEKPLRNRAFLTRRMLFGSALVGSCVFVALGLVAARNGGFVQRMPPAYTAELRYFRDETEGRKKWLLASCYFDSAAVAQAPALADRWNCHSEPGRAHILVIGDSHAGDKAMALRLNGLIVDEMTGPACALAPVRMNYKCRQKFDTLLDNNILGNYDLVMLAHAWRDLSEVAEFEREIDYWKRARAHIVLFGPMPEFGKFADRMSYLVGAGQTREAAARQARPDEQKLVELNDALLAVARRNGFGYFDTAAAFCQLSRLPGCVPAADQRYLIIDYAHLSEHGAELLGRSIVRGLHLEEFQVPEAAKRISMR